MYTTKTSPTEWHPLEQSSIYAAGMGMQRLDLLMNEDAYCRLLSVETRLALSSLFFSPEVLANEDYSLKDDLSEGTIIGLVLLSLNHSPIADLFAEPFKRRLANMVVLVVFGGKE